MKQQPTVKIEVSIAQQRLRLLRGEECVAEWPVSTALNGAGEQNGSGCTPTGLFRIRLKIGEGCPPNSVFVGRRPTGEIYSPDLAHEHPQRDWILTRILWLTGLESGHNRGGQVDTLRRYIYVHGTPDSEPMGKPLSHGCVRMRHADLISLFRQVENGTPVRISRD